jgi:hypothetical protein
VSRSAPRLRISNGQWLRIAAVLLGIAVPSSVCAAEKFQKISGSQISARLGGMEITDEIHSADVFQAGGNLVSYAMGRKTAGRWHVTKDTVCLERSKEDPVCYELWLAGKKVELRRPGSDMPFEGVLQKPARRQ